jgi:hypothetical protein
MADDTRIGIVKAGSSLSVLKTEFPDSFFKLVFSTMSGLTVNSYIVKDLKDLPPTFKIGIVKRIWDGIPAPAVNSVQGLPWIHIHNQLLLPIEFKYLNGVPIFVVGPRDKVRYLGYEHMGVPFGEMLLSSIITDIEIDRRISDLVITTEVS